MEVKVNEEHGFLKDEEFKKLSEKAKESAIMLFNKRATMGNKEKIDQHREALLACPSRRRDCDTRRRTRRAIPRPSLWPISCALARVGNAQVPLTVALVAYMIKVFLSTTCSPWSNTCRSTSDFFSSLVVVMRERCEA